MTLRKVTRRQADWPSRTLTLSRQGGSPSQVVFLNPGFVTNASSWDSHTVTFPSLDGKAAYVLLEVILNHSRTH